MAGGKKPAVLVVGEKPSFICKKCEHLKQSKEAYDSYKKKHQDLCPKRRKTKKALSLSSASSASSSSALKPRPRYRAVGTKNGRQEQQFASRAYLVQRPRILPRLPPAGHARPAAARWTATAATAARPAAARRTAPTVTAASAARPASTAPTGPTATAAATSRPTAPTVTAATAARPASTAPTATAAATYLPSFHPQLPPCDSKLTCQLQEQQQLQQLQHPDPYQQQHMYQLQCLYQQPYLYQQHQLYQAMSASTVAVGGCCETYVKEHVHNENRKRGPPRHCASCPEKERIKAKKIATRKENKLH